MTHSFITRTPLLQRYLAKGGYEEPFTSASGLDVTKPTPGVVGVFAKFLRWYADGRPGDSSNQRKGGRRVSSRGWAG